MSNFLVIREMNVRLSGEWIRYKNEGKERGDKTFVQSVHISGGFTKDKTSIQSASKTRCLHKMMQFILLKETGRQGQVHILGERVLLRFSHISRERGRQGKYGKCHWESYKCLSCLEGEAQNCSSSNTHKQLFKKKKID